MRGATDGVVAIIAVVDISIHAPREGSDGWISGELTVTVISIHAPREGSDNRYSTINKENQNFNPRSP